MNVRKEPLVLGATVITVGLLVYSSLGEQRRIPAGRGGPKPAVEAQRIPDVSVATPAGRDLGRPLRDLFSPPRDTHPLPPLDIDPPPFAPLSAVFPPPLPGPQPALYGKLLRADPTPTFVPALFATDAAGTETANAAVDNASSNVSEVKALGYVSSNSQEALNAEQRAAQVAGYKKLYDWFRADEGAIQYGRIQNKDKFALKSRPEDPLIVVLLDPVTGKEKPPPIPITFERKRVNEFHFADTVANRIAERRRDFGDKVTPGKYGSVMTFAEECVASRNEAPEALDLAIEMYTLAETITPNDPAPRLGLARCYELKFDFESAYSQLESLLTKYEHSPEIQVHLGQLEARLRLFGSAEQRFVDALRGARQSFEGQWAYGRFLLERGRAAEALEHLELAHQFEPPAEQQAQRLGVRLDLAAARF
ncbi:MAG TPA: hypothetical protein VM509_03430, partial [Planctomycetota bacterium]|nr:hypothetical protein [Planctomycetota bacterium]